MIDKELIKKQYKEWVDEVCDDLEDKTYFTIDEIVEKVTELTLQQVKNNDLLHSVSGCFTEQDMLMAYCNGASESTVNDLDLTIQVGTKVDAENFLNRYKNNNR